MTFVAGQTPTAAELNAITTAIAPGGIGAWTNYTPTLTQSATPTYTVEYASYMKIGRMVTVQLSLGLTSAGTAANAVVIGLPTGIGNPVGYRMLGHAGIYDASASAWYLGMAQYASTTTFTIVQSGFGGSLGAAGSFTAALASGDKVTAQLTYQVNS